MQHTPGPWTVSPTKHRTLIVSALGFQVAAADDLSAADASLICAAPAMLEALRDAHMGVCNWIPTNFNGWQAKENLLQKIDRAIRAATGEV